jgi:hypothetical protein
MVFVVGEGEISELCLEFILEKKFNAERRDLVRKSRQTHTWLKQNKTEVSRALFFF